jgi:hypothetical protein
MRLPHLPSTGSRVTKKDNAMDTCLRRYDRKLCFLFVSTFPFIVIPAKAGIQFFFSLGFIPY